MVYVPMSMVAPPAKAGLNEVARMPSRRSSNFLEYWQKVEDQPRISPRDGIRFRTSRKLLLSVEIMASMRTTPLRRAHSAISRASWALAAKGFSTSTCLPCSMQVMAIRACVLLGVPT